MGRSGQTEALRRAIALVAVLNIAYFAVEFSVALSIRSVSLFADSVDFLEDASVNALILLALGWSARSKARLGMVLAGLILVPGVSAFWTAWQKFIHLTPPEPLALSLTGAGAFVVNLGCALILARFQRGSGSMAKAAFLSARNDVIANVAIVAAGLVTFVRPSAWPDLVVGLVIAMLNIGAAKEVFEAAVVEQRTAA